MEWSSREERHPTAEPRADPTERSAPPGGFRRRPCRRNIRSSCWSVAIRTFESALGCAGFIGIQEPADPQRETGNRRAGNRSR